MSFILRVSLCELNQACRFVILFAGTSTKLCQLSWYFAAITIPKPSLAASISARVLLDQ